MLHMHATNRDIKTRQKLVYELRSLWTTRLYGCVRVVKDGKIFTAQHERSGMEIKNQTKLSCRHRKSKIENMTIWNSIATSSIFRRGTLFACICLSSLMHHLQHYSWSYYDSFKFKIAHSVIVLALELLSELLTVKSYRSEPIKNVLRAI